MKYGLSLVAGATLMFASYAASAMSGVAATTFILHAGPGDNFPEVSSVPATAPLQIYGCIEGYRWCDVMWKDQRGWTPGDTLKYQYRGRPIKLYDAGSSTDIPVVVFKGDSYWHDYYANRPFYRDRDRYIVVKP